MTNQAARSSILRPIPFHYCKGCGHSVLHRLIAESIEELGLRDRTVGVASVGCSLLMYDFLDVDFVSSPAGCAPSVATGLKRANPDSVVFTYQGDSDAIGQGLSDLLHAIARGERITAFVVVNATTGLSGGHMAPTTLPGQRTRSTPRGRDPVAHGHPLRLSELIASLSVPARIERIALDTAENISLARSAVGASLAHPLENGGPAVLEVLAACPTYWGLSPDAAIEFITNTLSRQLPPRRFDGK